MKIKPIHYYFALGIAILIIGIVFLINCIINFSKCEIEYSELTYEELTFTGYKKISGYRGSTTYNIHFRGYVKPFKISTITQKYLDEDLIENLNENQIMKVYYRSTADKDYAYDICEIRGESGVILSLSDYIRANQREQIFGIISSSFFFVLGGLYLLSFPYFLFKKKKEVL